MLQVHTGYWPLSALIVAMLATSAGHAAPSPASNRCQADMPAGALPMTEGQVANPERDRKMILAMQGEYAVDFAFDETVVLKPGYERAPAQRSGANEWVVVVEDTPAKVVLQHILVDHKSGHVTKHWRQDWVYQAPARFTFSADQTWTTHPLDPTQTRGAWTQCVYEVSDAPRYCSTGHWRYQGDIATWTGDQSLRPLPRREYTKRKDYNVLAAINRHTVTPDGWTHEQFNTKVQRGADGCMTGQIAREFGFNAYRRTTDVDFTPARTYWDATGGYWARVRARWAQRLSEAGGVHLKTTLDGMGLIVPLFGQAGEVQSGKSVSDRAIDAQFKRWVAPAGVSARGRQ